MPAQLPDFLAARHIHILKKNGDTEREKNPAFSVRISASEMVQRKRWRDETMDKKRCVTCLTVLILVLILGGIFYYIFCVNSRAPENRGTLVRAFSQKVNECCI